MSFLVGLKLMSCKSRLLSQFDQVECVDGAYRLGGLASLRRPYEERAKGRCLITSSNRAGQTPVFIQEIWRRRSDNTSKIDQEIIK